MSLNYKWAKNCEWNLPWVVFVTVGSLVLGVDTVKMILNYETPRCQIVGEGIFLPESKERYIAWIHTMQEGCWRFSHIVARLPTNDLSLRASWQDFHSTECFRGSA